MTMTVKTVILIVLNPVVETKGLLAPCVMIFNVNHVQLTVQGHASNAKITHLIYLTANVIQVLFGTM